MVPPGEAYARVRRAAAHLSGRQLFKKIDSTLRGNVGPELRAVLDEYRGARAMVCSALPREGRVVRQGIALLNGVPVHLTCYGTHPLTPCRVSDIRVLLRRSGVDAVLVGVDDVRRGSDCLRRTVASTTEEAVVLDAETDDDLRVIAEAFPPGDAAWVACGSSGLAAAVAAASGRDSRRLPHSVAAALHPALCVIGSRNPTTVAQVEALSAYGNVATIIDIDAQELVAEYPNRTTARWVDFASAALAEGRAAVLTTSLGPLIDHRRADIAMRLGDLARTISGRVSAGAFLLSGGSTAWSVCRNLDVEALAVTGEIERGVVTATALTGEHAGAPIHNQGGRIRRRRDARADTGVPETRRR